LKVVRLLGRLDLYVPSCFGASEPKVLVAMTSQLCCICLHDSKLKEADVRNDDNTLSKLKGDIRPQIELLLPA